MTRREIIRSFWAAYPEYYSIAKRRKTLTKGQNAQACDCRQSFCDYIDYLYRAGRITERQVNEVTL
jgi:hypothetical protein